MKNYYTLFYFHILLIAPLSTINAQSISEKIVNNLLNDSAIKQSHVGICIYEPAANKYWYNYNASKYFIPASNTKIFSLYAGMKYLGDSLPGLKYIVNNSNDYFFYPTGDPTFLHPDFKDHPVFAFLRNIPHKKFIVNAWRDNHYGRGWSWDDYNDDYMVERNIMPIYGNVISLMHKNDSLHTNPYTKFEVQYFPDNRKTKNFSVKRLVEKNVFKMIEADKPFESFNIPFITDTNTIKSMLLDTLRIQDNQTIQFIENSDQKADQDLKIIYSQPSDSVFIPMMHRSDNFFAEQTLLMASNEKLGYMNDEKIIDTLLKSDLKDIPQKPKWVDGSGLSRYNLFTPQSFVYILNKMKKEFNWERIKRIFPTGGTGTLSAYYKKDSGFIYAKTGTLTNNCSLSGYLITKKNKILIFSIMANNYPTAAAPIRRAIERFLRIIREEY